VTINPMAKPARQRETLHTRAIYKFHPMFESKFTVYYGDDDGQHQPATIEGGDVHVIGHRTVLIGMGERRPRWPSSRWRRPSSRSDQADRVIAIELPHSHAFMHLDTVMSMVDTATFVLYPYFDRGSGAGPSRPASTPASSPISRNDRSVGHPGRDPRGRRDHRADHRRGHPGRRA
jgi:arginine deiminase